MSVADSNTNDPASDKANSVPANGSNTKDQHSGKAADLDPMQQPQVNSEKDEDTGFLKSVIGAFALISAWVFAVGWTYMHAYYQDFGINPDSLGVPVFRYFVLTFTQFATLQKFGLGTGVLLVLLFIATWVGMQTKSKGMAVLISCAYLALFWLGFRLTVLDADAQAMKDMGPETSRPAIRIEPEDESKFTRDWAYYTLASGNLRLLVETDDQIFVFVPIDTTRTPNYEVKVLAVDRHRVSATYRILCVATTKERIPCQDQ